MGLLLADENAKESLSKDKPIEEIVAEFFRWSMIFPHQNHYQV